MAEVRHCLTRGAHHFAHKCPPLLLETIGKQARTISRISALPSGLQWDEYLIYGPYEVENSTERGTVTQNSYARFQTTVADVPVSKTTLPEGYLSSRNRDLPRYGSCVKAWKAVFSSAGGQMVFIRAYSTNGGSSRSEPLYKTKTGYYDILEVSNTASQAQIKTAYYKQSFAFHPDRNAGSDAATVRFSEISEAYTVLGNIMLRRKYDRGLLSLADLTATSKPSRKDTSSSFSEKQQNRTSVMTSNSRDVFDFDSFIKSHYSEQLQRDRDIKARREEMQKRKQEAMVEKKADRLTEVVLGVMLVVAMGLLLSMKRNG